MVKLWDMVTIIFLRLAYSAMFIESARVIIKAIIQDFYPSMKLLAACTVLSGEYSQPVPQRTFQLTTS